MARTPPDTDVPTDEEILAGEGGGAVERSTVGADRGDLPAGTSQPDAGDPFALYRRGDGGCPKSEVADTVKNCLPRFDLLRPGETMRKTVEIDGEERHYFLHLPRNYDASKPVPLILVFNGYGDDTGQGGVPPGAEGMEPVTGFSELADRENFAVAYVNGNPEQNNSWNNGQWFFSQTDDIKLVEQIIDRTAAAFNIDESRVYFAGLSQGASFAHRAAAELGDRVAAVADVSGWMTGKEKPKINGYSIISIQSEDDPVVHVDGKWMGPFMKMKPEKYTSDFYRQLNGITEEPAREEHTATNGTTITIETSRHPETGTTVKSIGLQKEGHIWFGGLGKESSPINATNVIWDFFKSVPPRMRDRRDREELQEGEPV